MSLVKPVHAGYFCGQSVTALAERLRAGGLTSVELTQAALDTIARLNPTLNAFVEVDAPVALAQARKADALFAQGQDLGPLQGIPVAVKDPDPRIRLWPHWRPLVARSGTQPLG